MSFLSYFPDTNEKTAVYINTEKDNQQEKDARRPPQDLLLNYMTSFAAFLQDIASQSPGWSPWASLSYSTPQWRQVLDGPALTDVDSVELEDLLAKKLAKCTVLHDFSSQEVQKKRDINQKTAQLEEILDFLTEHFSDCRKSMLIDIVIMVSKNIFRDLGPDHFLSDQKDDESDLYEDPSWPHLTLVYQIFLKILEHPHFEPNSLKSVIDRGFLTQIFKLFESNDRRERELLKTTLHRIYGNFLLFRSFIRDSISYLCLCFLENQRSCTGISEVLEVLGAIIKGLSYPLKLEHRTFLTRVLIPLHKSTELACFSGQLLYCDLQMVTKDHSLVVKVVEGLLRLWPKRDHPQELHFIAELQSILDVCSRRDLGPLTKKIFRKVSQSIESQSYQVSQKGLEIWECPLFTEIIKECPDLALKILAPSIKRAKSNHWQPMVNAMADAVTEIMQDLIPPWATNNEILL